MRHSLDNSDQQAFADYLHAWAKTDIHAEIDGSQVPVKVIVGDYDPALSEPLMQVTFAKWYPRCEIEVFANAGHHAIDETPVVLATAIETFLAGV